MKKRMFRLVAALLVVCLCFSGCSLPESWVDWLLDLYRTTPFSQMEYQRPDLAALEALAEECEKLSENEDDFRALEDKIAEYSTQIADFQTDYALAYIHYCQNMSDSYWEGEYHYCEERTATVQAVNDRLLHKLAASSHRDALEASLGEGWYEDYEGESMYTEELQALLEQESQLVVQYYEIYSESMDMDLDEAFFTEYGIQMEQLYVDLVTVRQQIAREAGYDSYADYAYDSTFRRDYTVSQADAYCEEIRRELVPLYISLSTRDPMEVSSSSEQETYDHVRTMAGNMGGVIEEAFAHMSKYELYDLSMGENKFDGSYEVYLLNYHQPYVFVGTGGTAQDRLTFTHEFGHFCNEYASYGSMAGIDVAEIFSQGLEYLSLNYIGDAQELEKIKLAESLIVYVEQAAYASFEHQVYELPAEELTVENIRALFQRTGTDFGLDSWGFDSRIYVIIEHFFSQPCYVISYVVSNDAAMQLYQLEEETKGAGLKIYTDTLATEQEGLMGYLEEAGLESPFKEGRLVAVKDTLHTILQ